MKQREDNYAWEPQSVGNSFVNYVVHYSWPFMEFMAFTEALINGALSTDVMWIFLEKCLKLWE